MLSSSTQTTDGNCSGAGDELVGLQHDSMVS